MNFTLIFLLRWNYFWVLANTNEDVWCKECLLLSRFSGVTIDGVWIGERIYWPLTLGTTSNYSAIATLHTSQITTATAKPFPACCVFASRSLVTVFNSGVSSASRAQVLLPHSPVQNFVNYQLTTLNYIAISSRPPLHNSTDWSLQTVLLITSRHGPHKKHPVSTVSLLLRAYLFSRERVNWAFAHDLTIVA
jgi:hypothetical protein